MNQTKQPKERYQVLKKQMNHHDPDLAETAAREICDMIIADTLDLKSQENVEMAKEITEEFLKQVGSESFPVHSNAIRCLAEIVPKISKELLVNVFKRTIGSITDPKVESKRKEVFSSSASEMIERAPGDLGKNLSALFVECVTEFISLSSRKNPNKDEQEVLIHLLVIIINFTTKWPDVVGNKDVVYNRPLLIEILLTNIQNSPKIELIIKCVTAIGALSAIFDKSNFDQSFNSKDFGLLNFIRRHQEFERNEEKSKKLKNSLLCLDHIVGSHNREMKPWAQEIVILCVTIVNDYKNIEVDTNNERELLVLITEIIESSIDCLTSVLKAYSSELSQWIGSGNNAFLSNFIEDTLNFDPECLMNYFTNSEMEDEYFEDEDYYYTEDSICWKVREVSLNYVTMLMRKDNEFKEKRGKDPEFINLLSQKLTEENENVNKGAFGCFNYIIESISTTKVLKEAEEDIVLRRVKSTEGNFALELVDKISQQIEILFKHKKTKEETKTEASKTLLNIIELLNELIKDNEIVCTKILNLIQELLPKVKAFSCVNLIKSSISLLGGNLPYDKTESIIDVYLKMTTNSNFKVAAASFDALRNVIKNYHYDLFKNGKINEILREVSKKLTEHDADKLIKIQTIRCLGPVFKYLLIELPEKDQNELLSLTNIKLKVEMDKTVILSQIPNIPSNYQIKNSQLSTFKELLENSAESIGASNYELNSQSIASCDQLLRLLGKNVSNNTIENILSKSKGLLVEGKIPNFLHILIENYPKSVSGYAELIAKTGENEYNLKLIKNNIISLEKCIQILKTIANTENIKKLSLFYSQVNNNQKQLFSEVNESSWGFVSIGALGYIGDLGTLNDIVKIMNASKNADFRHEAARAIGNIVSRNTSYVINLIELSKQPNDGFLYLHAIKEMLSFLEKEVPELETIIRFIFSKAEEKEKESSQHLLAECIGYITRVSPRELSNIIGSIPTMNESRRFIVASSLKYALEPNSNGNVMDEENIEKYIEATFDLGKDKDINVREGALKSLNSVVSTYLDKIRVLIDATFVGSLLDSMTIKAELIKIIDYGVSKEKKDLGKGLRIEAFNFLKAILGTRQIEDYFDPIISKCLEKLNEETSNDLILKRVHIIRIICEKDFTLLTPHQSEFASHVGVEKGALKPFTSGNAVDDERNEGYLKGLLGEVVKISALNPEGLEDIKAMSNKIKTYPKLERFMKNESNN